MKLNQTIKRLRKDKKITQEQLAELTGVSLMTVRRWEWGETSPNSNVLARLAEVLGVTPETLLRGTDEDTAMNYLPASEGMTVTKGNDGRDISLDNKAGHLVFRNGGLIVDLPDTPENKNLYWRIVELIMSSLEGKPAVVPV